MVNNVFIFWFLIHWIVSAQVYGFWPLSIKRLFPGGSTWPLSIIRRTSYLVLQTSNQLSQSVDLCLKSFFSHLNSSWQRQKGTVHNLQIVSMMFYSSRHLKPHLRVAVIAMRQGESNVQTLLLSSSHYPDYNGRFHIFANCFLPRCSLADDTYKRSTEIHVIGHVPWYYHLIPWLYHGTATTNIVFCIKTKVESDYHDFQPSFISFMQWQILLMREKVFLPLKSAPLEVPNQLCSNTSLVLMRPE